jgi:hypothetical protein
VAFHHYLKNKFQINLTHSTKQITVVCNDYDFQGTHLRIYDTEIRLRGYNRMVIKRREIMNWNRNPKTPNKKH